ncbi:MAG: hypothetical protein ACE5FO_06580 [Parvularculaceae bacterium]
MGQTWLTDVMAATWLPAAAAFVFGLAAGWLFWGGQRKRIAELERALEDGESDGAKLSFTAVPEDDPQECQTENPVDREKAAKLLDALEDELKAARARIERDAEESAALADGLAALDETIKRVNGRLKFIVKAVKSARRAE